MSKFSVVKIKPNKVTDDNFDNHVEIISDVYDDNLIEICADILNIGIQPATTSFIYEDIEHLYQLMYVKNTREIKSVDDYGDEHNYIASNINTDKEFIFGTTLLMKTKIAYDSMETINVDASIDDLKFLLGKRQKVNGLKMLTDGTYEEYVVDLHESDLKNPEEVKFLEHILMMYPVEDGNQETNRNMSKILNEDMKGNYVLVSFFEDKIPVDLSKREMEMMLKIVTTSKDVDIKKTNIKELEDKYDDDGKFIYNNRNRILHKVYKKFT